VIRIEKGKYISANIRRTVQTFKRIRPKVLQVDSVNNQAIVRPVRKTGNLEGFEKLKPKVNHRYYFALLNSIEKGMRKDHYTQGQEDLILYDTKGCLIGGF